MANELPPAKPRNASTSGSRGCLTAVMVFGLVCLLLCLAGVGLLAKKASSPDGKKLFSAVGKGLSLAAKAQNAPGAKQLRALGCPQVMIMEIGEVMEIVHEFSDAGSGISLNLPMVVCQGNLMTTPPTCEEIAKTYVEAVHPQTHFIVSARKTGDNEMCTWEYSAEGAPVKDLGKGEKRKE